MSYGQKQQTNITWLLPNAVTTCLLLYSQGVGNFKKSFTAYVTSPSKSRWRHKCSFPRRFVSCPTSPPWWLSGNTGVWCSGTGPRVTWRRWVLSMHVSCPAWCWRVFSLAGLWVQRAGTRRRGTSWTWCCRGWGWWLRSSRRGQRTPSCSTGWSLLSPRIRLRRIWKINIVLREKATSRVWKQIPPQLQ